MIAMAKIDSKESSPPRTDVKKHLVEFARELGFDSCRVAACSPPAHAAEFDNWLNDRAHGEMDYMARSEEKRRDPQKILPGAKSIIVLALNYFQGAMEAAHPRAAEERPARGRAGSRGRIARYAWGDDYHNVIAAKLDKVDNFLRQFGS